MVLAIAGSGALGYAFPISMKMEHLREIEIGKNITIEYKKGFILTDVLSSIL